MALPTDPADALLADLFGGAGIDRIQQIPLDQRVELLSLLTERDQIVRGTRLERYRPYERQREFHRAGALYRERLFRAGNQLGKTLSGGYEVAMHLTGDYPEWWDGKRFPYAVRGLCGSETAELTRKGIQRILLGPPEVRAEWGTGAIPRAKLRGFTMRQGVADAVATLTVKHASGDLSSLQFASYDQGRSKWQADTLDFVWFDEEPDLALYSEGLTRTQATEGMVFTTFTPLLGMSDVVKRFLRDKVAGTIDINMTIEDVGHYTEEQRASIIASYPEHEREARAHGVPMAGSGRVFLFAESSIAIEPFPIPVHWPKIVAWDFGIDHPAALVWLAWDRDTDTVYVYDVWRERGHSVVQQAAVVVSRPDGRWIPNAWPHDGTQRDKGSSKTLAQQAREAGAPMRSTHATWPDGGFGFEAGISAMTERFLTRKLRVFSHLRGWFEEYRMYHRENGQVVKVDDDLLSATRVGLMDLRFSKTVLEVDASRAAGLELQGLIDPSRNQGWGVLDPATGY